jgi:acid stress-induced BolA-like protein IbaG/YrbA
MVTPQQIEGYLRQHLECEHLAVDGDGAHFQAVIVSTAFEGKSRVGRHQVVYGALGDRMREEIHALSMQTLTPAEWQATGHHPAHGQ